MQNEIETELLDLRNKILYFEQTKKQYEDDLDNMENVKFNTQDDSYSISINDKFNDYLHELVFSQDGQIVVFNGNICISYLDMTIDNQNMLKDNNAQKVYINGGKQILLTNQQTGEKIIYDVVSQNNKQSYSSNKFSLVQQRKNRRKNQKVIMKCENELMKVVMTN